MHTHNLINALSVKDIQALKNARVFIAGDVILDSYTEGNITRISPEAPIPILLETGQKHVPGGAGNVAANISKFGAYAQICARIGNDNEAIILKQCLETFGVNTQSLITEENSLTTTKNRIVSYHEFTGNAHQIVRLDRESIHPIENSSAQKCIELYKLFIRQGGKQALVLSDYGKGFLTADLIKTLIQISNEHNIPVITDPKSTDVARYENSTAIKPNLSEGRVLFRLSNPDTNFSSFDDEIKIIANHYISLSKCHNVVMSLAQHGVCAIGKDIHTPCQNNILHLETKALQVADVSGAGDTFIAFLAMSLATQIPLNLAVEIGNTAAGIVCSKAGTSVVYEDELFNKLLSHQQSLISEKHLPLEHLSSVITNLQKQNKKIVFTNGCFDILHAGHVEYLQKAKSLGDFLVIGLNSDKSIKRLKGSSRPVQTFSDRASILTALACVDFVVEFDDDTPINLILNLKPDLLVKGADYNIANTVGATEVIAWGGRVEHIPLLEGRSTTSILNQILY